MLSFSSTPTAQGLRLGQVCVQPVDRLCILESFGNSATFHVKNLTADGPLTGRAIRLTPPSHFNCRELPSHHLPKEALWGIPSILQLNERCGDLSSTAHPADKACHYLRALLKGGSWSVGQTAERVKRAEWLHSGQSDPFRAALFEHLRAGT